MLDRRPTNYRQCLAAGFGIDRPCPYYGCRQHLGLDVGTDGSVRVVIDPADIAEAPHTCAIAAGVREWTPREIAAQLGISLGLEELIQRHALLKVLGPVNRVYDTVRRCYIDVDGTRDCR